MFEQIVRSVLWIVAATYVIGTFKTLTLAAASVGGQESGHVVVAKEGRKPVIYPAIDGTDMPMPFADGVRTDSRVVGVSKLYYAVYAGSTVRDTRYRSFWR